ncbi:tetratricopeptide repeat protein [Erythrobacter oryzae]|uniref:tetratricopeptide repeat protein n=1 Tax=Erythrobacter oryzae TaxID=3019556 RepID=UPI0025547816|nr:tetratricopeptide repeat protein [Erythrobacter sp. COR-2]
MANDPAGVCGGVRAGWERAVASGKPGQIAAAREAAKRLSGPCPELQRRIAKFDLEARRQIERERAEKKEAARLAAARARQQDITLRAPPQLTYPAPMPRPLTFEELCERGDAKACGDAAEQFWVGSSTVPIDLNKAMTLYERACRGGSAGDCGILGLKFEFGRGPAKDLVKARYFYNLACEGGVPLGCHDAADMARLIDVNPDRAMITRLYGTACDGGVPEACEQLGDQHFDGNWVEKSFPKAAQFYRLACETDPESGACLKWAKMLFDGRGIPADGKRAAQIFEQGCKNGQLESCDLLGEAFESGEGVPQDDKKAVALWKPACEQGYLLSCQHFGLMLIEGAGVEKNEQLGFSFLNKACAEKISESCTVLSVALLSKDPSPKNKTKAFAAFQESCERGNYLGCGLWGSMFEDGWGTKPDPVRALELYEQSCESGLAAACASAAKLLERGRGKVKPDRYRATLLVERGLKLDPAREDLLQLREKLKRPAR